MAMNRSHFICKLVLSLVSLLATSAYAADFIDLRRIDAIVGNASAAKPAADTLCMACHGANGISPAPLFPDLAGQKAEYLYHQLVRFKSGVLPESPMTALMAPYSDQDLRNFSVYYASLQPPNEAATIVDQALFTRGERLFAQGDAQAGVPPCQGCHGVDARGVNGANYLAYPMLRHQKSDYVVTRLKDYRSGKLDSTSNDFIMQSVAHRLDDDAIAAIAAWLASAP
jgi:cytochrome c553